MLMAVFWTTDLQYLKKNMTKHACASIIFLSYNNFFSLTLFFHVSKETLQGTQKDVGVTEKFWLFGCSLLHLFNWMPDTEVCRSCEFFLFFSLNRFMGWMWDFLKLSGCPFRSHKCDITANCRWLQSFFLLSVCCYITTITHKGLLWASNSVKHIAPRYFVIKPLCISFFYTSSKIKKKIRFKDFCECCTNATSLKYIFYLSTEWQYLVSVTLALI